MARTIVQKVLFKNSTPDKLYDLYMNAKLHTLVTGGPAIISKKAGSSFSAHGNYITGKNLHLVPNKMIVQTWRAQSWSADDGDSVFTIALEPKGKDVVLHAVHTNLPDHAEASVSKGWHDHYWNPWKQYLAGKTITIPKM